MNGTQSFKIYELLNEQFQQPERARELTEAIESVIDQKAGEGNIRLESALKKDLGILRSDIAGSLRTEIATKRLTLLNGWLVFLSHRPY